MKTKLVFYLFLAILVFSITATASMMIPANDNAKQNAKAPEKSPVIGENWDLERVDFIHYAKGGNPGKPPKPGTDICYKLMGIKWTSLPVDYVINPSNPYGLSQNFVVDTISSSSEVWDVETSSALFSTPDFDYSAVYGKQNYENAIDFGDLGSGIIGITSVWYTRVGKRIVEFDIRLNTDYPWGDATVTSGVMDLQNIATHELGHAVGMNDIYSTSCSYVTMYGYSGYNDIDKRTLEQPDITGLQKMYG